MSLHIFLCTACSVPSLHRLVWRKIKRFCPTHYYTQSSPAYARSFSQLLEKHRALPTVPSIRSVDTMQSQEDTITIGEDSAQVEISPLAPPTPYPLTFEERRDKLLVEDNADASSTVAVEMDSPINWPYHQIRQELMSLLCVSPLPPRASILFNQHKSNLGIFVWNNYLKSHLSSFSSSQLVLFLADMFSHNITPNLATYNYLLRGLWEIPDYFSVLTLYSHMIENQIPIAKWQCHVILLACEDQNNLSTAFAVLEYMKSNKIIPSSVMYDSVFSLTEKQRDKRIVRILEEIKEAKLFQPTLSHYTSVIAVLYEYARMNYINSTRKIKKMNSDHQLIWDYYAEIKSLFYIPSSFVFTVLLSLSSRIGQVSQFESVLRDFAETPIIGTTQLYTTIITSIRQLELSPDLLFHYYNEAMNKKIKLDLPAYTVLISAAPSTPVVLSILHAMKTDDIKLNNYIYGAVLYHYSKKDSLERVEYYWNMMKRDIEERNNQRYTSNATPSTSPPPPSLPPLFLSSWHYSIIMSAYGKKNHYDRVIALYSEMRRQNIFPSLLILSTLMTCYARMNDYASLEQTYNSIYTFNLIPDAFIYHTILLYCSTHRMIKQLEYYLNRMKSESIRLNELVYMTIIAGYGNVFDGEKLWHYIKEFEQQRKRESNNQIVRLHDDTINNNANRRNRKSSPLVMNDTLMNSTLHYLVKCNEWDKLKEYLFLCHQEYKMIPRQGVMNGLLYQFQEQQKREIVKKSKNLNPESNNASNQNSNTDQLQISTAPINPNKISPTSPLQSLFHVFASLPFLSFTFDTATYAILIDTLPSINQLLPVLESLRDSKVAVTPDMANKVLILVSENVMQNKCNRDELSIWYQQCCNWGMKNSIELDSYHSMMECLIGVKRFNHNTPNHDQDYIGIVNNPNNSNVDTSALSNLFHDMCDAVDKRANSINPLIPTFQTWLLVQTAFSSLADQLRKDERIPQQDKTNKWTMKDEELIGVRLILSNSEDEKLVAPQIVVLKSALTPMLKTLEKFRMKKRRIKQKIKKGNQINHLNSNIYNNQNNVPAPLLPNTHPTDKASDITDLPSSFLHNYIAHAHVLAFLSTLFSYLHNQYYPNPIQNKIPEEPRSHHRKKNEREKEKEKLRRNET